MTRFTTLTDLAAGVRGLYPDAADLISDRDVAMAFSHYRVGSARGRYEDVDADALRFIAECVMGEVESR